jgi:dTMP kinase
MKIIAIEGIDKSGKYTQTRLLCDKLINDGYRVQISEFHRYDQHTGALIMKWLKNEWKASQNTIELIMAADKQLQQEWFEELEKEKYDFLILDRYTLSQFVYGAANNMDINWIKELQRFMRKPDLDIVIDISAEISIKRKGKYGENDRYESDLQLLEKVRSNYLNFPADFSSPIKIIINGERTIEQIHNDIYIKVKGVFGL